MKSALADLYHAHVSERCRTTERALAETGFERLLLHSGTPHTYFADDQDAPFHPTPHFTHWAPVEGPGHLPMRSLPWLTLRSFPRVQRNRESPRKTHFLPPTPFMLSS